MSFSISGIFAGVNAVIGDMISKHVLKAVTKNRKSIVDFVRASVSEDILKEIDSKDTKDVHISTREYFDGRSDKLNTEDGRYIMYIDLIGFQVNSDDVYEHMRSLEWPIAISDLVTKVSVMTEHNCGKLKSKVKLTCYFEHTQVDTSGIETQVKAQMLESLLAEQGPDGTGTAIPATTVLTGNAKK